MVGDRGFLQATALHDDNDVETSAVTRVHAECQLDTYMGHLVGICSCTGRQPGRARARAVWDLCFDKEGKALWPALSNR